MSDLTKANLASITRSIISGLGTIAIILKLISPEIESQLEIAVFQIVSGLGLLAVMGWQLWCNHRHAKVEILANANGIDIQGTKQTPMAEVKAEAARLEQETSRLRSGSEKDSAA